MCKRTSEAFMERLQWRFILLFMLGVTDKCCGCKPNSRQWDNVTTCVTCNDLECVECRPGYYGSLCRSKCPEGCHTCGSFNDCTSCINGFYGNTCSNTCPDYCEYSKCSFDDGRCTDGCKNGYFPDTTSGSGCKSCPADCSKCSSDLYCTLCKPGFYGLKCGNKCQRNCKVCHKSYGHCTNNCPDGTFHDNGQCIKCRSNCELCATETNCAVCKSGHFGTTCEHVCSKLCLNGCSKSDGECIRCIDGYFKNGTQCRRCSQGCAKCGYGNECQQCADGYYPAQESKRCDVCGENCVHCTSNSACFECTDGFWGLDCGNSCGDYCIRCNQSIGICTELTEIPQSESSSSLPLVLGIPCGIVLASVFAGLVLMRFARKQRQPTGPSTDEM